MRAPFRPDAAAFEQPEYVGVIACAVGRPRRQVRPRDPGRPIPAVHAVHARRKFSRFIDNDAVPVLEMGRRTMLRSSALICWLPDRDSVCDAHLREMSLFRGTRPSVPSLVSFS